ncbi:MAG: hypothetical protein IT336_09740 [Thermomicrobiales bacterium]|nr:hypothetical protein [Thermomicrobiales bacterium]
MMMRWAELVIPVMIRERLDAAARQRAIALGRAGGTPWPGRWLDRVRRLRQPGMTSEHTIPAMS